MHVAVAPRTVLPSTAIVTSLGEWAGRFSAAAGHDLTAPSAAKPDSAMAG